MKSKVHPRYKTKYRVANWAAYNQALVRRGDVTVWVSSEAIAAWTPGRSGRRGGQRRYSDLAIETALTLRLLYHLPLRQAEGFLHALFGMMRLDLSAPDYTTLSRRSQHLRRRLRPVPPGEGIHLVLDSTGLSIVGAGEWATAKHGGRGRRGWRKLHLGVDQSGVIRVHTLTEATGDDATTALDLLTAVDGPLVRVTADAAYDTVAVYERCSLLVMWTYPPCQEKALTPQLRSQAPFWLVYCTVSVLMSHYQQRMVQAARFLPGGAVVAQSLFSELDLAEAALRAGECELPLN